jgi:predicted transcriptional regulator
MTTASPRITVAVEPEVLRRIDSGADAATRTRSQHVAHILKVVTLAGRARLAELEQIAERADRKPNGEKS